MQAYAYKLFLQLGLFIPLIVVNCIVLGRAEAFASRNGIVRSFADGLGIGIGFTLSLAALGGIREVLGTGFFNLYGYGGSVFGPSFEPFTFVIQAPGAFVCLGLMLCIMNLFE
jgi:electron transport complex protein RnfE